jgi:hypothetical protein
MSVIGVIRGAAGGADVAGFAGLAVALPGVLVQADTAARVRTVSAAASAVRRSGRMGISHAR